MKHTSHCGLGQTAANPLLDGMRQFPESFEVNLKTTRFEPAFDLDAALEQARQLTHRDDPESHIKVDNT